MFRFEKFDVWQKSIEFADSVYGITRTFPQDERFGLTSQMRRADGGCIASFDRDASVSADKCSV
jgi:hypothetical protein